MTDDAFLAAIRADPADRTARLAYADWLEERGDPRAELVRACEAMRRVPVYSDEYWRLKARRNELRPGCPAGWLAATGYDGSDYDPVFRDGVPGDWRGRWRLVREFTERWHGVDVPDIGGRRAEVREAEERLGLALPPSVQEYIAYAHDLRCGGAIFEGDPDSLMLFHCALYQLEHIDSREAVGLIYYTLSDGRLGVAYEDLADPDPRTFYFSWEYWDGVDHGDTGTPIVRADPPIYLNPSLSLSVLCGLLVELPTAGGMETNLQQPADFLRRVAGDFPVHARFDDADLYESDEMMVLVVGPRARHGRPPGRDVRVIVRRPIPIESVPDYLFGTDERDVMSWGMLGPEPFRRQQAEEYRRRGVPLWIRWTSAVAKLANPRPEPGPAPGGELPRPLSWSPDPLGESDIPF
jgi:uncharacterized protein (TIGR02996 family)